MFLSLHNIGNIYCKKNENRTDYFIYIAGIIYFFLENHPIYWKSLFSRHNKSENNFKCFTIDFVYLKGGLLSVSELLLDRLSSCSIDFYDKILLHYSSKYNLKRRKHYQFLSRTHFYDRIRGKEWKCPFRACPMPDFRHFMLQHRGIYGKLKYDTWSSFSVIIFGRVPFKKGILQRNWHYCISKNSLIIPQKHEQLNV